MREPLIKQAVTFLTNPGIKPTSWEKKQEFLNQKGLTAEEIEEAKKLAEAKEQEAATAPSLAAPSVAAPASAAAAARAAGIGAAGAFGVPGRAEATGPAPQVPGALPHLSQAVLLLRRRLAELDHERACYLQALEELGDVPAGTASAALAAASASPLLAPPLGAAAAAACAPAGAGGSAGGAAAAGPAMWPGREVPAGMPPGATVAPPGGGVAFGSGQAAVAGAPAKKPWETGGASVAPMPPMPAPALPSVAGGGIAPGPGGGELLRDDDPDLMELLPGPPRKPTS
mmetsp:Transcript_18131/g.47872  ORF Transcript_18131/g.47872 Transcript_18131/m.47872 type:complete len:286 (-) Transcript_18131:58-915(-)